MRLRQKFFTIYMVAAAVIGGISGCSRRTPVATVVLVDPSASVAEVARKEEFDAVAALIPRMQRGDLLTVIPITDNAAADIQGRVLRLSAPERREAYDADLRRFRVRASQQYSAFAANMLAHPGQWTDILGALDVARQEFEAIPDADRRELIVLSDFLEDDGAWRFTSDQNLAGRTDAERLGICLREEHYFKLPGVRIYLGAVESTDFKHLDRERQTAVQAFWTQYLAASSDPPAIHFDGTGMMQKLEH